MTFSCSRKTTFQQRFNAVLEEVYEVLVFVNMEFLRVEVAKYLNNGHLERKILRGGGQNGKNLRLRNGYFLEPHIVFT